MSFHFFPSKKTSPGVTPPMHMPNVFVTPPEEDETPAWCYFDANNPMLSQVVHNPDSPDISVLAFPSDIDSPGFHRNPDAADSCIMPQRTMDNISIVDALIDGQYDHDVDSDTESDYGCETPIEDDPQSIHESTRHQPRDIRNAADDSDVVEVVKVSRRRMPQEQSDAQSIPTRSDVKRTQTLKSRASKVFRSLRGSLRHSKPEPLPQEQVPSRPRTPIVSRRGSKILSQLFTAPSLKSQTSIFSIDDQAIASPRESVASPTSSMFSIGNPISHHHPTYTASLQDEARLRATSPTPTTSSSKSATRRFSMLSLQKLFSFSPASPTPPISATAPIASDDSGRTTPTPRSTSSPPPSVVSSDLTSGPQTPTSSEEVNHVRLVSRKDTADIPGFDSFESVFDTNVGLNLGLGLGLNLDSDLDAEKTPQKPSRVKSLKNTWDAVAPKRFSRAPPPPSNLDDDGDKSLEMRLDSLHFDSLSFDADNFLAD